MKGRRIFNYKNKNGGGGIDTNVKMIANWRLERQADTDNL